MSAYRSGRHEAAFASAQAALSVDAEDTDAHNVMATILLERGLPQEAFAHAQAAVVLEPYVPEYLVTLASCERALDRQGIALDCLHRAIALDAELAPAHAILAGLLQDMELFPDAERAVRRAIELSPGDAGSHGKLVRILLAQGRPEDAVAAARSSLAQVGEHAELYLALGQCLRAQEHMDQAREAFERAVELDPRSTAAHLTLGVFLFNTLGEIDAALAHYREARAIDPNESGGWFNEALVRLSKGDYSSASWDLYEWRKRQPKRSVSFSRIALPAWDGLPGAERGLVVHGEQGVGDEIMFASLVPEASARVGRCALLCDPRLEALLSRSLPGVRCLPWDRKDIPTSDPRLQNYDCMIAAGSLGRIFRALPESFAGAGAFLRADPARVDAWRRRLAAIGPGPYVGLAWRGGIYATGRARRSLGAGHIAEAFACVPATWISLQRDANDAEIDAARFPGQPRLAHLPEVLGDIDDTAALISALDAVVTVCSWIVHLAGGLGRPAFVLAPLVPDFRYGLYGRSMPWYRSVRMYRQERAADWSVPLAEAPRELAEFLVTLPRAYNVRAA
jgi:tetratricopeptide (TPR) repeat protein